MYTSQNTAAGYIAGSVALMPSVALSHWPWLVLLGWIIVGALIVMVSHLRFSMGHRRFLQERRIAALQIVPGVVVTVD